MYFLTRWLSPKQKFLYLFIFWMGGIFAQFLFNQAVAQTHALDANQADTTFSAHQPTTTLADTQFIRAVQLNRAYHVEQLLNQGHSPNAVDDKGNPMLTLALYEDAFDTARVLLHHSQTNVNQANQHGETPLMLACLKGQIKLVKEMVDQYHAQINHAGWTPLHYAASAGQIEITRFLLEHHAHIDAFSPNHTTPLMMAARGGHIYIAKLLLDTGADVFLKNDLGLNAADFAERYQHAEIATGLRSRMRKLEALRQ